MEPRSCFCLAGVVLALLCCSFAEQDPLAELHRNIAVAPFVRNDPEVTDVIEQTTVTFAPPYYGPLARIKLEKYDNPTDKLQDGSNCDPFGWSRCDPYFVVVYKTTHNGEVKSLQSNNNDDTSQIDFPLFMGFMNPIVARAPIGSVVEVQVVGYDDDDIGSDEIIGTWSFYYVVGSDFKRETKQSGAAIFTLSFNTTISNPPATA